MSKIAENYAKANFPDEPSCGQFGTGDYEPYVDCSCLREITSEAYDQSAKDTIARIREWANKEYRQFDGKTSNIATASRIAFVNLRLFLDELEKEYE